MPATAPISVWAWVGFILVILVFLALDLGLFHKTGRIITTRQALLRSTAWILAALLFAAGLAFSRGRDESMEFVTAYCVELSLSLDNVAAIALIFAFFAVEARYQHNVLFWGIIGALMMRGLMIGVGVAMIGRFPWVLYIMGVFLIVTGSKWLLAKAPVVRLEDNRVMRLTRKLFPVSQNYDGAKFLTRIGGRIALTPLALVLLTVETTDLVFACDSVPAVFAVTQKAFIVFTSNILAIAGLRSLYFAVADAIRHFRYLKAGLALVLIFVGAKMLAAPWYRVPTGLSLALVAAMVVASIIFSIQARPREKLT